MPEKRNIPVLLFVIMLSIFSNYSFAQHTVKDSVQNNEPLFKFNKNEKQITHKGNVFTYAPPEKQKLDTATLFSPKRKPRLSIQLPLVLTMNGQKIYDIKDVKFKPEDSLRYAMFERYLFNRLSHLPELGSGADGSALVNMDDIVIDTTGSVAFYNFRSIIITQDTGNKSKEININEKLADRMFSKSPHVSPAMINGHKVVVRLGISMADYDFKIKNHIVTYTKKSATQTNDLKGMPVRHEHK